jgi:hypothetical protein
MRTAIVKVGSCLLAGVLGSAIAGSEVDANTHVHTQASVCKNYNASEALDIDQFTHGVRNINASARSVVCSVPRVTQTQEGTAEPWVYIAYGNNNPGKSTSCTLYAYSNNGNLRQFVSFNTSAAVYAESMIFPGGAFSTFSGDYITLFCTLPGGGGGWLRGFSAIAVN